MKPVLGIALATSLAFASCAKKPTTRITVKVAETFSGDIRLTPCISVAKDPVEVDRAGYGYTPACPAGDVEIVVIKPSKTYELAPENISVRRRSDGEPSTIVAQVK
jgi:hypothetical protein